MAEPTDRARGGAESDSALLVLQDGTQLRGKRFGACKSVSGEVGRAQRMVVC